MKELVDAMGRLPHPIVHQIDAAHPVQLLAPAVASRSSTSKIRLHVKEGPLPPGSFYRAAGACGKDVDLYLPAPGLLAAEAATELLPYLTSGRIEGYEAVVRITRLLMELCGSYSHGFLQEKTAYDLDPISSVGESQALVASLSGMHGSKIVRRGLALAADGSASPMESFVWAALCFPSSYGGFGLHGAELNHQVIDGKHREALTVHRSMRGDIVWPEERIAIEYQGEGSHDPADRFQLKEDSQRIQDYQVLSYEVFPATWADVLGQMPLGRFAQRVASALKRKGRKNALKRTRSLLRDEAFLERQRRLLKAMLLS